MQAHVLDSCCLTGPVPPQQGSFPSADGTHSLRLNWAEQDYLAPVHRVLCWRYVGPSFPQKSSLLACTAKCGESQAGQFSEIKMVGWDVAPLVIFTHIQEFAACINPWVHSLKLHKPGMVAHICHPRTQELEAGGSEVQAHILPRA